MALSRRTAFRTSMAPIAATALAAVAAPSAMASEGWCDVDPIQLVITSGGKLVPIFVTNGAPSLLYVAQLLLAKMSTSVQSADGGTSSLVTVKVTVPNGLFGKVFSTRTVVSSGPLGLLKVYGTATGTSGRTMTVQFKLPVG
jgi:hypothetical protein